MKKILIVDDAVTVRKYERQMVENLGIETDEAINGLEALEKLMHQKYDLLLVDINMPKMTGYELLEEMRKNPELKDIPVIMISTEAEKKDKINAYKVGANFYVVKPIRPETITCLINLLII
ncbi:response regulator [Desulfothermus naphthae]